MIPIKGIQKTSMIDYPPNIASVIFLAKCNFRCGYCQNPDLVLRYNDFPTIKEEEVLDFLHERKKWIDGVVITGGEPLLYDGLIDFIKQIKDLDLKVKIDTNGTNPELLFRLINEKLVDYIAMDIKTTREKYFDLAGVLVDMEKIEKSISLIIGNDIDYEFRSTVIPKFFTKEDAVEIGKWLKGAKKFVLQQFRKEFGLLDESFKKIKPYSEKELDDLRDILGNYINKVELRNV